MSRFIERTFSRAFSFRRSIRDDTGFACATNGVGTYVLNVHFLKSFDTTLIRTHLTKFLGISERCGRVLDRENSEALYEHGTTFCKRYVALSEDAVRLET